MIGSRLSPTAARVAGVFAAVVLVFSTAPNTQAQGGLTLDASVAPNPCMAGDVIQYTVNVTGSTGAIASDPELPELDATTGLSYAGSVQTSRSMFFGGGEMRTALSYSVTIQTSKSGTFSIPPTVMFLNGQRYESKPVEIRVLEMPAVTNEEIPAEIRDLVVRPRIPNRPDLEEALTGALFVLPHVTTTSLYSGQQVSLAYFLCVDNDVLSQQGLGLAGDGMNVKVPATTQFLKDEIYPIPNQIRFQDRLFGSRRYSVAALYHVAVTPTRTGRLEVEPFALRVPLRGPRSAARVGPFNDPFFRDMYPPDAYADLRSPAIQIDVRPLPTQGQPAGFRGAVGQFTLTASVDQQQVAAGDDFVRLQVKIEGSGDAAAVTAPELPPLPAFEVLGDAKARATRTSRNDEILSTKVFEYLLRANEAGSLTIPPIELAVFDPYEARYETLRTQPISVTAQPGTGRPVRSQQVASVPGASNSAGIPADEPEEDEGAALRFIYTSGVRLQAPGLLQARGAEFAAAAGAPVLLLALGWLAGIVRRSRANGLRAERESARTPEVRLRERLAFLESEGGSMDPANFARGVRAVVLAYPGMGDPAVLVADEVLDELERTGRRELAARMREVIAACDAILYAGGAITAERRGELLALARHVADASPQQPEPVSEEDAA